MSRRSRLRVVVIALLAVCGLVAGAVVPAQAAPHTQVPAYRSCAIPAEGRMHCHLSWHPSTSFRTSAVKAPKHSIGPAQIRSAYHLPTKGGKDQTIAVIDAYDNPRLEHDLSVYRKAHHLPACTTANGCFRKVDQRGGTAYPQGDPGWGLETALDVQAVSAACRQCRILVVEGDDESFDSLGEAVNTAVSLGADVVSNSYGSYGEFTSMLDLQQKYYTHPGVAIVASSGDDGFIAASAPAVFATTWAVGGTSLDKKHGKWKSSAWDGAGSGCSAWIAKPAYQTDTHCSMRTVSDISALADPYSGFAVYDTYGLGEENGWLQIGGTSLAAPLVAGMIGLAGNADKASTPSYAYAHRSGLQDIRGGSNGYCGKDYLCTAVKGYDAPTGLGSPRGLKSL